MQRTLALMRLADDLRAAGPDLPLAHVDAPFGLQLLLGTLHPPVKFAEAAALLRGPEPAFVVVKDMPRLRAALGADAPRVWGVAGCTVKGRPYLHVIGNRPQLAVVP